MGQKDQDIRWQQRFSNYTRALQKLTEAVDFISENHHIENAVLAEMSEEGVIQRFEYTHELAWNVMKDYAEYQGETSVGGSRDATREAFQLQLITDGDTWMEMIKSRNESSHTYNSEIADNILGKIINEYYPLFVTFKTVMEQKIKLWPMD
jgi:nucleotidyltransferase substrate binding protein (TIGR01987 family)